MAAAATSPPPPSLPHPPKPPPSFPTKANPLLFLHHPTFLCHSTTTTPNPSPASSTPSLSDQLKSISLNLLRDKRYPPEEAEASHDGEAEPGAAHPPLRLSRNPKSTWVNPSRPRPRVLSLHRHPRAPAAAASSAVHRKAWLLSRALDDCSDDLDAFSAAVREVFPDAPPPRDDALVILRGLRPWQKALRFFGWLKVQQGFALETIFYNTAMKSLRVGRQYERVEELALEMVDRSVELDNITYSTVITCAKRRGRFDRAIDWFERMYRTGLMPDEITYSAVLDVYANLGNVGDVFDGITYVLEVMKATGVEPNLAVYNTLLEAMGRARKPQLAQSLFDEMLSAGLIPDEKTLTALTKIYGKAGWGRDALELWERTKANRWPMNFFLYNTLLSTFADVGLEAEAEEVFAYIKAYERCQPTIISYTAMINIYASGGKLDKAKELFDEMLSNGVQPNVMSCTCLIQCLGKARRIEEAVKVFGVAMENGVVPDDRLCACLLSVIALCKEGEVGMVLECLEKGNAKLAGLLKMLGDKAVGFDVIKAQFREILNETEVDARRPFCNCLIDVCRNQNFPAGRAHELFSLGYRYGLYPGLHSKASGEWSLNLRTLSIGAAYIAFEDWMKALSKCLEGEVALPQLFTVHTGTGSHKFSKGLGTAFAAHLEEMAAPFQQNEDKRGCFMSTKEDLVSWLQSRVSPAGVVA